MQSTIYRVGSFERNTGDFESIGCNVSPYGIGRAYENIITSMMDMGNKNFNEFIEIMREVRMNFRVGEFNNFQSLVLKVGNYMADKGNPNAAMQMLMESADDFDPDGGSGRYEVVNNILRLQIEGNLLEDAIRLLTKELETLPKRYQKTHGLSVGFFLSLQDDSC